MAFEAFQVFWVSRKFLEFQGFQFPLFDWGLQVVLNLLSLQLDQTVLAVQVCLAFQVCSAFQVCLAFQVC